MKHFDNYPFLKARFDKRIFFPQLLNQYFLITGFVCNRFHQPLPPLIELLLELALTKKILFLGKYDVKKIAGEFGRATACTPTLLKEIKGLKPESRYLLVAFILYYQKAFDNGYKKELFINLLQLLVHIEKRFGHPDLTVPLFTTRMNKAVVPNLSRLNLSSDQLKDQLSRPHALRKKIQWNDPGFELILNSFRRLLAEVRIYRADLLNAEVIRTIETQVEYYHTTWELVADIRTAVLNGQPI
jgi:hypothetical protein